MLRKDIRKHQENDDKVHVHLVLKSFSSFREEQKILSEGEAVVFKLSGYDRKKENDDKFYSKPFYTSPGGYKMWIGVDTNGRADGAGSHVSVSTEILEGHYDDQLHWPFLGTVTFELLNQLTDNKHHIFVAVYMASQMYLLVIAVLAIHGFSVILLSPMTQPPTLSISLTTHCTSECQ